MLISIVPLSVAIALGSMIAGQESVLAVEHNVMSNFYNQGSAVATTTVAGESNAKIIEDLYILDIGESEEFPPNYSAAERMIMGDSGNIELLSSSMDDTVYRFFHTRLTVGHESPNITFLSSKSTPMFSTIKTGVNVYKTDDGCFEIGRFVDPLVENIMTVVSPPEVLSDGSFLLVGDSVDSLTQFNIDLPSGIAPENTLHMIDEVSPVSCATYQEGADGYDPDEDGYMTLNPFFSRGAETPLNNSVEVFYITTQVNIRTMMFSGKREDYVNMITHSPKREYMTANKVVTFDREIDECTKVSETTRYYNPKIIDGVDYSNPIVISEAVTAPCSNF
jgi:hypothetical protein